MFSISDLSSEFLYVKIKDKFYGKDELTKELLEALFYGYCVGCKVELGREDFFCSDYCEYRFK